MLRSVNSMAVGMAIEHRKTLFPADDAVDRAEVNIHANDNGDGRMCPAVSERTIHEVQK